MHKLNELPADILYNVTTHLSLQDFRHLRLVSRALLNLTLRAFAIRYFQVRTLIISSESLQNLTDVSSHPFYHRFVRTIEVCTDRLAHTTYCLLPAQTLAEYNQYFVCLREQNSLIEQNLPPCTLASALKRLPNCTKLSLADNYIPRSADRLATRAGADLDRGYYYSPESSRFISYLWLAMLESAGSCETGSAHITELDLFLGHIDMKHSMEAVEPRLLRLPSCPSPAVGLAMAKIEAFSVILNEYVAYSNWLRDLTALLRSFPRLSRLRLAFDYPSGAIFPHDPDAVDEEEDIVVPMLQRLELSWASGNGNQLARLLQSHRQTLRTVILDSVNINGDPAWPALLAGLHKSLPFCSFHIINCFYEAFCISSEDLSMEIEEEFEAGIALLTEGTRRWKNSFS